MPLTTTWLSVFRGQYRRLVKTREAAVDVVLEQRSPAKRLLLHLHDHLAAFEAVHGDAGCLRSCHQQCTAGVDISAPDVITSHCLNECDTVCLALWRHEERVVRVLHKHAHRLGAEHGWAVAAARRRLTAVSFDLNSLELSVEIGSVTKMSRTIGSADAGGVLAASMDNRALFKISPFGARFNIILDNTASVTAVAFGESQLVRAATTLW